MTSEIKLFIRTEMAIWSRWLGLIMSITFVGLEMSPAVCYIQTGLTASYNTLLFSMGSGYNEQHSSFFNFISSIINFAYVGAQLVCVCV